MHHKPCQPVVVRIQHGSIIKVPLFAFIHQIPTFVVMPTEDILFTKIIVLLFFMIIVILLPYFLLITSF